MPVYMISVTCAAALSGIILSLIFYRLKILSFRTAAAITMASLITALVMPDILSLIYSSGNNAGDPSMPAILALVSVLAYLILILIFGAAISFLLPKIKIGHKAAALAETESAAADAATHLSSEMAPAEITEAASSEEYTPQAEDTGIKDTEAAGIQIEDTEAAEIETKDIESADNGPEAEPVSGIAIPFTPEENTESFAENIMDGDLSMKAGDNYIEEIFLKFVGRDEENLPIIANNESNEGFEENSDEKSVDSNENIDKMGIENNIHDSDNMTIEECIDEAFRLRETGDPEGSILYYMYALDKKPQKELTFWIILDICVMYKSLGQQDLALDILDSYYDIYGDEMDSSVKEEIARNLTDIGA